MLNQLLKKVPVIPGPQPSLLGVGLLIVTFTPSNDVLGAGITDTFLNSYLMIPLVTRYRYRYHVYQWYQELAVKKGNVRSVTFAHEPRLTLISNYS